MCKSMAVTSGLERGLVFCAADEEQGDRCCSVLHKCSDLIKSAVKLQMYFHQLLRALSSRKDPSLK